VNPHILVRCETAADVDAIRDVTVSAFKKLEVSGHTEQFVIAALRAAEALAVSLVAEVDGQIVGHIAFSPVTVSDGTANWYGLGPLSVLPEYQRQGIGKALIEDGLSRLTRLNARGVCLVGHPDYTENSASRTCTGWCMRECPTSSSSLSLSTDVFRREPLRSMKHSMRIASSLQTDKPSFECDASGRSFR
jgi:putative acetyltransferase